MSSSLEYTNSYRKCNPDKVLKWKETFIKKYGKDYFRNKKLMHDYGITGEQYDEMFRNQNGLCAICLNPEKIKNHRTNDLHKLVVDHNHETNKIRGLLCRQCNRALGMFQDDITLIKSAIKYLEATKCIKRQNQ